MQQCVQGLLNIYFILNILLNLEWILEMKTFLFAWWLKVHIPNPSIFSHRSFSGMLFGLHHSSNTFVLTFLNHLCVKPTVCKTNVEFNAFNTYTWNTCPKKISLILLRWCHSWKKNCSVSGVIFQNKDHLLFCYMGNTA